MSAAESTADCSSTEKQHVSNSFSNDGSFLEQFKKKMESEALKKDTVAAKETHTEDKGSPEASCAAESGREGDLAKATSTPVKFGQLSVRD